MRVLLLVAALLAPSLVAGAVCKATNEEAPSVSTLMVAKDNDKSAPLWVVMPDCNVTKLALEGDTSLWLREVDINWVESVPSQLTSITFRDVSLSSGGDFSAASKLYSFWIDGAFGLDVSQIALPASVVELSLMSSFLRSLDDLNIPSNVNLVRFGDNEFTSFKNVRLPKNLLYLYVSYNKFSSIDFDIPESLDILEMRSNLISTLEGVSFPDSITLLEFGWNPLTQVRGVKWPKKLNSLRLEDTKIVEFEIRRSDLPIFQRLNESGGTFSEPKCTQPTAEVVEAMGVKLCVIDDDLFTTLYEGRSSRDVTGSGSQPASPTPSVPTTTDNNKLMTVLIILIAVVGVVIIAQALFFGYRALTTKKAKKSAEGESDKYTGVETPSTSVLNNLSSSDDSRDISLEYLTNDIRNDKQLLKYRIDLSEISLQRQIARGGFGAIFKASYRSQHVAIKQMLPETLRDDAALAKFMDEIRLCATFDHPKIVSFIGVAWSSLRDLSVVIEYMPGGDLWGLLQKQQAQHSSQREASSPRDWLHPWTPSYLRSKASIAQDVAEAVVFLHSFSTPILHRDLKARNVLLDERGNAKLSDFGISREMSVDETMTSGVGTAAWIAPEVLRGEKYTEMADMYSLGVLLVELDRCSHPYAADSRLRGGGGDRGGSSASVGSSVSGSSRSSTESTLGYVEHKNTQIAVLVSTGRLRPRTTRTCPEEIQHLVKRCLSFEPYERPTAMEVTHELRRIRQRVDH